MKVVEEYLRKRVLFSGDKDGNVWVNDKGTEFEDGSPVSIDDIIGILRCYGQEMPHKIKVWFWDDESNFILFDAKGEPVIKIEDGKIRSAAHDCICDKTFPMHAGMLPPGTDVREFMDKVEKSGIFDKGKKKRKLYGFRKLYRCETCGNEWILETDDLPGYSKWYVKSRMEQRV